MNLGKALLLSLLFLFPSTRSMDKDVYYVRFVENITDKEGQLTTFPKSMLKDMKTLIDIQNDLGEDLGSQENPFPVVLSIISPDDFDKIIALIQNVQTFFAKNPQQNGTVDPIQEAIWDSLPKNRYTHIADLIRICDHFRIDPVINDALFLCITKTPREKSIRNKANPALTSRETIDDALQAGLKVINKLPEDNLKLIKETLLHRINLMVEGKIIYEMNNPIVPRQAKILEFPDEYKENITAAQIAAPHTILAQVGNNKEEYTDKVGFFTFDDAGKNTKISWLEFPQWETLGDLPNQHLLSVQLKKQNKDPKTIKNDSIARSRPIFILTNDYSLISFYDQNVTPRIGIGYIFVNNKVITIPNEVAFCGSFKNNTGQLKLACIVGTQDDEPKIVIVDPISGTCDLIKTLTNQPILAATILESKLIYKTLNHSIMDVNPDVDLGSNDATKVFLQIMDLHSYTVSNSITIDITNVGKTEWIGSISDVNAPGHKIAAHRINDSIISIVLLRSYEDIGRLKYTVLFDLKTSQFGIFTQPIEQFVQLYKSDALPSKILLVNLGSPAIEYNYGHGGSSNLHFYNICTFNGALYMGALDINMMDQYAVFKYLSAEKLAYFKQIKELTNLSIEQIYALEEIVFRLVKNQFTGMTPTEKQLFESMPLKDQNLFHEIFSTGKPITDLSARQFIVDPKKASELEASLPGYILPPTGGVKRRAQEVPEEQRPTKKHKTKKVEESEEESSSDETTQDESEDNE